jgi:hypothetical protein
MRPKFTITLVNFSTWNLTETKCKIKNMIQGSNFIAAVVAIAVEGEQNAVDHCGNDGNFLPYIV